MRDQAKHLDENQGRLSEQLDASTRQSQHSLRDAGEREQVQKGLAQQRERLDQLLDQMRRTVEDAEETEPLLAKGLFDTVRKATEQKIPDALKVAEQLVEVGVAEDAAKTSRFAGKGIEQMREGIERAAKSVLGDETAALKRAQGELEDLADQVNREIARTTEPAKPDQKGASPRPSAPQGRDGQGAANRPSSKVQDPQQEGQQDGQLAQRGQPGGQPQQKGQGNPQGQQGQGGQRPLRGGNTPPGDQPQPKDNPPGEGQGGRQAGSQRGGGGGREANLDQVLQGLSNGPGGPITGEGFRQWSDRMRDVEELLQDPELRAEAARIRDRVRGAREDFKRHSKEPDWNQLKELVADPIQELRDRVAEEVRRRETPDALVPIDRDPVPPQFSEGVRRYYERLGSGR
jgi:hypothetical protein